MIFDGGFADLILNWFFLYFKDHILLKNIIAEKIQASYMYIFYIYTTIYVNTLNLILIIEKIMFGYMCLVCYPFLEQKNYDELLSNVHFSYHVMKPSHL